MEKLGLEFGIFHREEDPQTQQGLPGNTTDLKTFTRKEGGAKKVR